MRTCLGWLARAAVVAGVGLCSAGPATSQDIALLPVHDRSAEAYGDVFARFLTAMLFETLEDNGWQVVLLNPGGLYSPLGDSWSRGYASQSGMKAVILPVLAKARRQFEKDDHPRIVVHIAIIDPATGTAGDRIESEKEVKRRDLERGFEVGGWSLVAPFGGVPIPVYRSSRTLSKQPLGKAVIAIANSIQPRLSVELEARKLSRQPGVPSRAACGIEFGVRYVSQNAVSRAYAVMVNGREESAGVDNGKLTLRTASAKLVFEVSVRDAPFRLPVQPLYFANTVVDCSRPERGLTLEIGPSGEGWLVWR